MSTMHTTYVEWLRAENEAFATACQRDLAAPVPSCPGWTILDLLTHHASYQSWITTIVTDRLLNPVAPSALTPPQDDPVAWYRSIGAGLVDTLRTTPGTTPVWTVTTTQTVTAWARRQASETAVHRWDAENATGAPQPIQHGDEHLDEMFHDLLPGLIAGFGAPIPQGTLTLVSTDTAHTRQISATNDGIAVLNPDDQTADATLAGTASDLVLALWNRPNRAALTGDITIIETWRRTLTGAS